MGNTEALPGGHSNSSHQTNRFSHQILYKVRILEITLRILNIPKICVQIKLVACIFHIYLQTFIDGRQNLLGAWDMVVEKPQSLTSQVPDLTGLAVYRGTANKSWMPASHVLCQS